jgi:histidine triad (HIT) family protein
MAANADCRFCQIASHANYIVFEDELSIAFLDYKPLFIGHTVLIPKAHYATLADLPPELLGPFFANVQLLAHAVEQAIEAEGSFVAINNKVSQSVPHLHVHIVPRRKKDGLRGFFWPRQAHPGEEHMRQAQTAIQAAVARLTGVS